MMQKNGEFFFDEAPELQVTSPNIKGINYDQGFLSTDEQKELLNKIDEQLWLEELERRVQHYGVRYDYKKSRLNYDLPVNKMPNWLMPLLHKLVDELGLTEVPDQLIINEYLPGQGITSHIDSPTDFKDLILIISLGSMCIMEFTSLDPSIAQKEELLLTVGSLLTITGDARYKWKHAIPQRKTDNWNNKKLPRSRRVSLTFRYIANEKLTSL